MAKFKKGESGNPSGRPAGTKNKVTRELRAKLKNIIDSEIDSLPGVLNELEPLDRMNMIIKLMPYCMPRVESVSATDGEPFTIEPLNIDDYFV